MKIKLTIWRLPDLENFKIKNWYLDKLLLMFGINKKNRRTKFTPANVNRKVNRYLLYTELRLIKILHGKTIKAKEFYPPKDLTERVKEDKKLKGIIYAFIPNGMEEKLNGALYFSTVRHLILKSRGFQLFHLRKVNLNFGRKMSVSEVREIFVSLSNKLSTLSTSINLQRKWLQSPAGKNRALTIPSFLDRVISSMWTGVLDLYLQGTFRNQHAYLSGKGTGTAWRYLFNNLFRWANIFEFDLSNFFPSVSQVQIKTILSDLNIPHWVILYLTGNAFTIPKMSFNFEVIDYMTNGATYTFKDMEEVLEHKGEPNFAQRCLPSTGVPQGLGYSPLLATIVLQYALTRFKELTKGDYVCYADDGILFWNATSRNVIEIFSQCLKDFGILLNIQKSGFIKRDNEFLREFKFLGLVWNPFTNLLKSKTRKGANLTLNLTALRFQGKWLKVNEIMTNILAPAGYSKIGEWKNIFWWPRMDRPYWINKKYKVELNWHELFDGDLQRVWAAFTKTRKVDMSEMTWSNTYRTWYWGPILSRLYIGSWRSNIKQDFRLLHTFNSYLSMMELEKTVRLKNLKVIWDSTNLVWDHMKPAKKWLISEMRKAKHKLSIHNNTTYIVKHLLSSTDLIKTSPGFISLKKFTHDEMLRQKVLDRDRQSEELLVIRKDQLQHNNIITGQDFFTPLLYEARLNRLGRKNFRLLLRYLADLHRRKFLGTKQ